VFVSELVFGLSHVLGPLPAVDRRDSPASGTRRVKIVEKAGEGLVTMSSQSRHDSMEIADPVRHSHFTRNLKKNNLPPWRYLSKNRPLREFISYR
jgi:hypothetical protein